MYSNERIIKVIFYTKRRFIGEEYFPKNITFLDIKKYYKENIYDGTTLLYKNYYIDNIKLLDSDVLYQLIHGSKNILKMKIAIELREIEDIKHQFSLTSFDDENEEIYAKIIRPKLNPFGLIVFITKNNSIKIEQYPNDILKKYNLYKFNNNYAFCNSPNYLFLSGENNFWIISKKTYSITYQKLKIYKKNHSMLYIPDIGVFSVGGDNKTTFLYDSKKKKYIKWGDTNNNNYKPGLIYYDEYLYCFPTLNEKNKYFEKTYLGENTQRKWEIISPRFKGINPDEFYNNDFAISKSIQGKILLVGGNKNNKNTFIFNPLNNTIIKILSENHKIHFSEKIFYKLNKVINLAIPSDFEKKKELAILNKYNFSLKKVKYVQKGENDNNNLDINYENNIEIISDNQFGNFSIQIKFGVMNYNYSISRTFGIPVFKQIDYIKLRQELPKCICKIKNNLSQKNLLKNKIKIKQENIIKKNYSQANIKNKNENKKENINNNNKKDKNEIKNKNIINIIHKQDPIKFNQVVKSSDNNSINIEKNKIENQIITGNNKYEPMIEEKNKIANQIIGSNNKYEPMIEEKNKIENQIIASNNKYEPMIEEKNKIENEIKINKEQKKSDNIINNTEVKKSKIEEEIINKEEEEKIIDIKKEESIKEDKNIFKSPENEIKSDNKQEKKSAEETKNQKDTQFNISNKNDDTFNIFSNIKEIRNNPNYDIDESKTNKDFKQSMVTNFQLKESIQRNIISSKFNINSNEKNLNNEVINEEEQKIENKNINEESIEIKNYNEKFEQSIEHNEKNSNKENNEEQNESEKRSNLYINKKETEEYYNEFEEGQFKDIQSEKQKTSEKNIIEHTEQNENTISRRFEDFSESYEYIEHQNNIEEEINKQKIHDDIDPNHIIKNIEGNINLIAQQNKKEYPKYKENIEDNMAQNIEEDDDINDDNDIDENLVNNEQNEQNSEEEFLYSKNDEELSIKDNKNQNKTQEIKIELDKNVTRCQEQNIEKNESDFNINDNEEENKEYEKENKEENEQKEIKISTPQKENNKNEISEKEQEMQENMIVNGGIKSNEYDQNSRNNLAGDKIPYMKDFENEKIISIEIEHEDNENNNKEEYEEINNENNENNAYNFEENKDEEEHMNNEEMSYEENGEEGQIEENYKYQNEEEDENNMISYEIDEDEENKENGRNSIINISDDNLNNDEIKDLNKYQKFVKNVEYNEPEDTDNF